MTAERKSIYTDFQDMEKFGIEVICFLQHNLHKVRKFELLIRSSGHGTHLRSIFIQYNYPIPMGISPNIFKKEWIFIGQLAL